MVIDNLDVRSFSAVEILTPARIDQAPIKASLSPFGTKFLKS